MPNDEIRDEALALATCLLPAKHLSTLMYLIQFFGDVAKESESNKMDVSNLAIVLTPTLFPLLGGQLGGAGGSGKSKASKKASSDADDIAAKTKLIETLFNRSDKVIILFDK